MTASNHSIAMLYPVGPQTTWVALGKLGFSTIYTIGSIILTVCFVAVFYLPNSPQRDGRFFLGCTAIADMFVCFAVLPFMVLAQLSSYWDNISLCNIIYAVTLGSTYSYNVFFAIVSIEEFFFSIKVKCVNVFFTSIRPFIIIVTVLILTMTTAGIGVFHGLFFDYCGREHVGVLLFRKITDIVWLLIPALINVIFQYCSILFLVFKYRKARPYRVDAEFRRDRRVVVLNVAAYLLFAGSWIPYYITLYTSPHVSRQKLYSNVVWAMIRPLVSTSLYFFFDENFKSALKELPGFCKRRVTPNPTRPRCNTPNRQRRRTQRRASVKAKCCSLKMINEILLRPRGTTVYYKPRHGAQIRLASNSSPREVTEGV